MAVAFVSTHVALLTHLWSKGFPHIWMQIRTGGAKITFAIQHREVHEAMSMSARRYVSPKNILAPCQQLKSSPKHVAGGKLLPFRYPSSHSSCHTGTQSLARPGDPTTVTHRNRSSLGFSYSFHFLCAVLLLGSHMAAKLFIYMLILTSCSGSVLCRVHGKEWNIAGVAQLTQGAARSSLTGNIFFTVGILSLSFYYFYLFISYNGAVYFFTCFFLCAGEWF